jgi:hypothetical protein
LDETDVIRISARAKHMNVVAAAMGGFCRNNASLFTKDKKHQKDILEMGLKHYVEGLKSTPKNVTLLKGAASTLLQLHITNQILSGNAKRHEVETEPFQFAHDDIDRSVVLEPKEPQVIEVENHYRLALDLAADASLCCDYGLFLWQCGKLSEKCEEFLIRSLECNPSFIRGLLTYGDFLGRIRGNFSTEDNFYNSASSLSSIVSTYFVSEGSFEFLWYFFT